MSNIAPTCGGGGGFGFGIATPALTLDLGLPCIGFSLSLPSFSISFQLPSFSLSFFLSLFLQLSICDLSLSFNINAGVSVAAYGGVISICVPDPSLSEQTLAAA